VKKNFRHIFFVIFFSIFSLLLVKSTVNAACVSPLPPAFDTCPSTNSYYCYLDPTGMNTLTCCVDKPECDNFTIPTAGPTIPVYDPECSGFDPEGHTGFTGVKTALGCLPTDPQDFVNVALPWAIFLGAGIAFLLGVFGAGMIVLSAGNPEKMQAGKEMITSAIAGTIIIVFAVFLLDFIGVKVLKLFTF